ncbi:MAG: hypothetical protein ABSG68_26845 [Thermoguttaceae bacterium]|jgi:hypothetical protein
MSTAMGDLVVSLGLDNTQFLAALNGSGESLDQFATHSSESSSEIEGHVGGASRAFGFLGKEIRHAGEELGGENTVIGETISGLGGTVTGIGEVVHGYHAMHTAVEVLTTAQVFLNSISPLGWTVMIGGAVAAGAAYLTLSHHIETAAEAAEHLKKVLGDINAHHGAEFDKDAASKQKELQENLRNREEDARDLSPLHAVLISGTYGLKYLLELHAIDKAHSALDEFNKAVVQHRQHEAGNAADSYLSHLREEAEKLDKTPLEQFQENLAKSGRSAKEVAEELAKAKTYSADIENHAIKSAIDRKEKELSQFGMSDSQKYVANFQAEHPGASSGQLALVKDQAAREDALKNDTAMEKKLDADRTAETARLAAEVKSLTEGPMDKLIAQARDLQIGLANGAIGRGDYASAMAALQEKATPKAEKEAKEEAPKAIEYGTAAAFEELYKAMHPDEQQDHAQRTAENTAKMAELMEIIRDNTAKTVVLG